MIVQSTGLLVDQRRSSWTNALMAANLFAIDPAGLCGISVRSPPAPWRESWLAYVRAALSPNAPVRRMPISIGDDRLIGGIDLPATLALKRPVVQNGILVEADGGVVIVTMAERMSSAVAARINGVLDRHEVQIERDGITRRISTRVGVIAFDEGEGDERMPSSLEDRLAFKLDFSELCSRDVEPVSVDPSLFNEARSLLSSVEAPASETVAALVSTAASFGIHSIAVVLLALRAARAAAAFVGRSKIGDEQAALAASLVFGPRATVEPDRDEAKESDPSTDPSESNAKEPSSNRDASLKDDLCRQETETLEDVMREAVRASLPAGVLEQLRNGTIERNPSSRRDGLGTRQRSIVRGRPSGVRASRPRSGARLALIETLRAAAPWQAMRHSTSLLSGGHSHIDVRAEDFRVKKFIQRRDSTIVFCVDVSGSTAFQRLAEAKGAVELLLAETYVARTYASLIAFRGHSAELVLPPSRSVTRARSLLSGLPGGGGTPLATGLDVATSTAMGEREKGREPLVVLLTDGRANIARNGSAIRSLAFDEALDGARRLASHKIAAVLVDTSPRPRDEGTRLASAMGARYIALPQGNAHAMRDIVRAAAT